MEFRGQYLTYNEYQALGGTLEQTPFDLLEYEARKEINRATHNRIVGSKIPEEVKMCIFNIINTITSYVNDENTKKNLTSESANGYTVNYMTGTELAETMKNKKNEVNDIIINYLYGLIINGEHVIYCGVN